MRRVWVLVCVSMLTACVQETPAPPTLPPTESKPTATLPPTIAPTEPPPTIAPTEPPPTIIATEPPTAAATESPSATPVKGRPSFSLDVEPIVSGLQRPVYLTHAGDDRLFVVEQPGRIRVIQDGDLIETPFLDIDPLVRSVANEQGLFSVAFHPNYASNGLFFIDYTRQPDGATVIARYRVSDDPNVADPNSAEILLTIDQPEENHNGGPLQFGPDGYLYIGMGDGGGGGDRHRSIGNGQSPDTLLGKLLRIDVDNGQPYAIPASNPFVDAPDYRPEIWAWGLRNPWRFSFDRATGDLYVADVGQSTYEEVNFQPASSAGGENYGWRILEGFHCFNSLQGCDRSGLTSPIAEYKHGPHCSVTGGYMYRGSAYPWLNGLYFFADYCSGTIWSLERTASGEWAMIEQTSFDFTISSFGEDVSGELYLMGHNVGTIYRLTSTSP